MLIALHQAFFTVKILRRNCSALPSDITTSTEESNYFVPAPGSPSPQAGQGIKVNGFYTGNSNDANVGGFFPITETSQFAMTNDDACLPGNSIPNGNNNCDLSFEQLILPELNFTNQANTWILFDYYLDGNFGGGDAVVEISTDGTTWSALGDALLASNWQTQLLIFLAMKMKQQ